MNPDVLEMLDFFSQPSHPQSFALLPGRGSVLFSAPHAVLQTRDGRIKQAERYTGMLCMLLHQRYGLPCIVKTRHMGDDANHDAQSPYRDALIRHAQQNDIRFVLDLHQLRASRPMALCIGTGRGRNLCGMDAAPGLIRRIFEARHLAPVTLDDPFAAASPCTVSASAASAGIAAMQLELNTALVMVEEPAQRFEETLHALLEAARTLDAMIRK